MSEPTPLPAWCGRSFPTQTTTTWMGTRPTVALCMIARDEAPVIGSALESARGFVDEMIVVDTGSTDATADIARGMGARVIDFPWTGSFAEARNVYLDAATADWILVLDADEVLDKGAAAILEHYLNAPTNGDRVCLYQLRELSHLESDGEAPALAGAPLGFEHYIMRFFPRHAALRYHGRIHEDVIHTGDPAMVERVAVPALIHHYGYTPAEHQRKDRNARNRPLLEMAVAEAPEDGFAHFNLGMHLVMQGEWEDALHSLQASRRHDPGPSEGGRNVPYMASRAVALADTLRRLGRGEEAVVVLQEAMRDFPGMPDAPFHLGNLLLDQEQPEAGEALFRQAIALGEQALPSYFGLADAGIATWKSRLQLGMSLGRRDLWSEALPWLREAAEMAPGLPLAVLALGLGHFHLGAYDEALRVWGTLDPASITAPEIVCRMAEAWARSGDVDRALQVAGEAARRFPTSAEAVLARARIRVEVGDGSGALANYRRALERLPDASGFLEYGQVAAQLGILHVAQEAFEAAARLAPERVEPLNNLGALALNQGDLAAARGWLGKALRLDPDYDPAAWNMARAYIHGGEARRALAFLRMRLQLGRRRVAEVVAQNRTHDAVPGILLASSAAIRCGEVETAVAWLEALEATGMAPEGVLPLRIEAERARNNLGAALLASLRWIERCPGQLGAAQEAGNLLIEMGRFEDAAKLLDVVLAKA